MRVQEMADQSVFVGEAQVALAALPVVTGSVHSFQLFFAVHHGQVLEVGRRLLDSDAAQVALVAFAQARAFLPCNTFESLLIWSHIFLVLDKPIQHPVVGDEMTV